LKEFCKIYKWNKKTEKEKKKRKKNMKLGLGEPFGPVWRSSPQPRKETESVPLLLFSLADVWALPARPRHPSSSLDRISRRRPFLLCNFSSSIPDLIPAVSSPNHSYKKASTSSPFPLFLPCQRRHQADAIARRSPQHLALFFVDSDEPPTF
jgi:hypothetical protein